MRLVAVAVMVHVALAGCAVPGAGSASIYVKDGATERFDEVHFIFTRGQVHAPGEQTEVPTGSTDNRSSQDRAFDWYTVFLNESGIDVDLQNATAGSAVFLGEVGLAARDYDQIRLEVLKAYGIRDGDRVEFTVQNGTVTVDHPFRVMDGRETRLVLEFDLELSLAQKPTGGWVLEPHVEQVQTDVVSDKGSGEDTAQQGEKVEQLG